METILKREMSLNYYMQEKNLPYFISALRRDFHKAVEKWRELHKPEYLIRSTNQFIESFNKYRERVTQEAQNRYKRQTSQNEYINQKLQDKILGFSKDIESGAGFRDITYFDFKVFPGSQSINDWCIIRDNRLDDESLKRCWEIVITSEYFQNALGWEFVYDGFTRPQIQLILPKELKKKAKHAEESLSRAIENFYSGSNWWGD